MRTPRSRVLPWTLTVLAIALAVFWLVRSREPQSKAPPAPPTPRDAGSHGAAKPAAPGPLEDRKTDAAGMTPAALLERLGQIAFDADKTALAARMAPLLEALGPGNIREVVALLETVPRDLEPGRLWDLVLERWARFDGRGAFRYAMDHQSAFTSAIHAMRGWMDADPDAPARYLHTLPDADQRRFETKYVTGVHLQRDPAAAMRFAERLPDPAMRSAAAAHIVRTLARKPDGTPWDEVADWLGRNGTGTGFDDAGGALAASWVVVDAHAATAWVSTLPQGTMRDRAMREMIGSWAGADPGAAGDWLNAQPHGAHLDAALREYAVLFAGEDPGAAADWARAISDPALREATVAEIAQRAAERDPAR